MNFFQEHKRSNAKNRDSGADGVEGHGLWKTGRSTGSEVQIQAPPVHPWGHTFVTQSLGASLPRL